MSLYLFNISFDTADANPEFIPEDLSINDQESFVEIVVEQVLGYENAIKEYDDPDTESQQKKKNTQVDLHPLSMIDDLFVSKPMDTACSNFHLKDQVLCSTYIEIDSPPPKV